MFDDLYPIGIIIHSTTLSTADSVKAIYRGTTWISHSGYVLRGATSGVTANSASKTGGNDNAVVVQHSHSIPDHNHTFTGTSKNYTSGNQSANHTHSGTTSSNGAHTHSPQSQHFLAFCGSNGKVTPAVTNTNTSGTNVNIYNNTTSNGAHTHTMTTGNQSASHTHTTTIKPEGSIGNKTGLTASNNTGWSNGTNANIPNYKSVYIWERTA